MRAPELEGSIPRGKLVDLTSKEVAELEKFTKKEGHFFVRQARRLWSQDGPSRACRNKGWVRGCRAFQGPYPPEQGRIEEAHFRWLREVDNPFEGRENAFERLNILGFMEYVIHRNAGART